jgi:hypothetical protein
MAACLLRSPRRLLWRWLPRAGVTGSGGSEGGGMWPGWQRAPVFGAGGDRIVRVRRVSGLLVWWLASRLVTGGRHG